MHIILNSVNANIVNIPVESTFSMSVYAIITVVGIFNIWSVAALTVS